MKHPFFTAMIGTGIIFSSCGGGSSNTSSTSDTATTTGDTAITDGGTGAAKGAEAPDTSSTTLPDTATSKP